MLHLDVICMAIGQGCGVVVDGALAIVVVDVAVDASEIAELDFLAPPPSLALFALFRWHQNSARMTMKANPSTAMTVLSPITVPPE